SLFLFFFQAEDGIRDRNVTGVQTCALPIWLSVPSNDHLLTKTLIAATDRGEEVIITWHGKPRAKLVPLADGPRVDGADGGNGRRSEERRVGKEGRSG